MRCHVLVALVLSAATATMNAAGAKQPSFEIATRRNDDRVELRVEGHKAIFSIHSPFGISEAVIGPTDGAWPRRVVLRLHLKGLENFRVTNGDVSLETSASVWEGRPLVRVWKDGNEVAPLDSKSPFWMGVRILGRDGKPAKEIPLKDGYFEIDLPGAFFDNNPKSITLNWIDFYRG